MAKTVLNCTLTSQSVVNLLSCLVLQFQHKKWRIQHKKWRIQYFISCINVPFLIYQRSAQRFTERSVL